MGRLCTAYRVLGNAYASVLFGSKPWAGLLLMAMTLLSPASGVAAILAVIAANATALLLGYRSDAIAAGYYGYNALLLGLALVQGRSLDVKTALLVLLAGVASALLTAVLGDLLHRSAGLPVLALPFVTLGTVLPFALASSHAPSSSPVTAPAGPLEGLAAIFFQHGALAGLAVLVAAIAISRIGALAMMGGVVVAQAMAALLTAGGSGAPDALRQSMAYNAALTGLAVGAFLFVPSRASAVAGLAASALSAWLTVALWALFGRLGLPILAWPFVLVTLVTARALHLRAPDRPPFAPPVPGLSPEANHDRATALARRFGIPGPPRLLLPVAGRWVVSQGVGGAHTHVGPWAHAWDLEVTDAQGFPFQGDGSRTEDYLCFGAPVLAPGIGTVAAVHDGSPDGRPGDVDTARPWGNAVVIQHGPEVYSLLAHLKLGSIHVRPGQIVAAGEPVASCGSSGRSPRPHLHFQAQRTQELGAQAIPINLVHYEVDEQDGGKRYVFGGMPREGDRLARPEPAASLTDAFAASLAPGMDLSFEDVRNGGAVRLRSEITLLGERYLRDLDRGDRLSFTLDFGDLAFTAWSGEGCRERTPLGALLLAMPRLPFTAAAMVRYEDRLPAAAMLPAAVRIVHDLLRVFVDPIRTLSMIEARLVASELCVRSQTGLGIFGRIRFRYAGEVVLGPDGMRSLELRDARRPEAPPLVKISKR